MKRSRIACHVLAAVLTLGGWPASLSMAQSDNTAELHNQVLALYRAGQFAEAAAVAQRELAIEEKTVGPDDVTLGPTLNNLALIYVTQGRYTDAEPILNRTLALFEKAEGPNGSSLAQPLSTLAELYRREGRFNEAESTFKRAVTVAETTMGADAPILATVFNGLAMLSHMEGHYSDAEANYKQALRVMEKNDPNSIDVAIADSNLADLYRIQNRFEDAESLLKHSITLMETAYGPDYPQLVLPLGTLASVYFSQAHYDSAEALDKRTIAILEKSFGPNHPDIALCLNNLAELYRKEGRYSETEPLYKRSLSLLEANFGPDYSELAKPLGNLAGLYTDQGRYAEAEPLIKRSLEITEKAFGPDHPNVSSSLAALGWLYVREGRDADSEPLYERALAIREKSIGPDTAEVASLQNDLAVIYLDLGRYTDAEQFYEKSLQVRQKILGEDSPDIAQSLHNLGRLYEAEHRYAQAELFYRQALSTFQKAHLTDQPGYALSLNNLGIVYVDERRYSDAEPLYKQSLAIREKILGDKNPDVEQSLNNLVVLYGAEQHYAEALPLIRRTISDNGAYAWATLPALFQTQQTNLLPADEAVEDSLLIFQRAFHSSAGAALNSLASRMAAGTGRLAELVRKDQDLEIEAENLEQTLLVAIAKDSSEQDLTAEQKLRDRISSIATTRDDLKATLTSEFPDYAALSQPQPLAVKDIQELLADDEALVIVDLDTRSYVWVITRTSAQWQEVSITAANAAITVSALRTGLNFKHVQPFDVQASFALYKSILAPVEEAIRGKPRLSFVVNGALTSLPPQLLVTRDPTGKALKDVDWLVRNHAVAVLPSIASLKVLRGRSTLADAQKPLIGFADPVFNRDPQRSLPNPHVAANVAASRGVPGTVADVAELKAALTPLPDTAKELREVAAEVKADHADLFLGLDATETRVKQENLDQYRIVYFATHALVAGQVASYAKLNAEPALVLSLPETPTELDDGLLTASEVAQLKLNADWVVLSACNTAAEEKPGAEALSGLARAFFYAGGRSLLVSNWEVESASAVALMVGTFSAFATNPKLSHAEALQKSMLSMIDNPRHPDWADPKFWAPFIVVGEPAKPLK